MRLDQATRMKLMVPAEDAQRLIDQIPHATCSRAAPQRWRVADDGTVPAQSVLWLFCWGKTGMGSPSAALEARRVFDVIFPLKFDLFDTLVDHEYARKCRYAARDRDARFTLTSARLATIHE
jgi:hypothetical protein